MKMYDFLIVGAGLYGSTFAYMASLKGKKCLIIDKRNHIGGNIYCEEIEGINVHKYGAHIFHTSDESVWKFVNSIVPFNRYTNCPLAAAPDGKLYNLPFNMNTFYQMWGVKTPMEAQKILEEQRKDINEKLERIGVKEPRNLEEQALALIGHDIYEQLIKGYTEKQWGRKCIDLPADIIRRLPVRYTFDNNYFNDKYQGIPIGGYNKLIEGMLKGVDVRLSCNYFKYKDELDRLAKTIVYTGPIDEYFGYCFGPLEYRTVSFETQTLELPNYQGNAVVNYTSSDVPFTRIIEHKHFEALTQPEVYYNPCTVISREYSSEWKPGIEPFYPINDKKNTERYRLYKQLYDSIPCNPDGSLHVIFGGRLAEYKYFDMAPVISQVFKYFEYE